MPDLQTVGRTLNARPLLPFMAYRALDKACLVKACLDIVGCDRGAVCLRVRFSAEKFPVSGVRYALAIRWDGGGEVMIRW